MFWAPTLEQALDVATQTGRPIFLVHYTCVGAKSPTYSGQGGWADRPLPRPRAGRRLPRHRGRDPQGVSGHGLGEESPRWPGSTPRRGACCGGRPLPRRHPRSLGPEHREGGHAGARGAGPATRLPRGALRSGAILLLVLGSSLVVEPAASPGPLPLPREARRGGQRCLSRPSARRVTAPSSRKGQPSRFQGARAAT